jgi:hypothetical protein
LELPERRGEPQRELLEAWLAQPGRLVSMPQALVRVRRVEPLRGRRARLLAAARSSAWRLVRLVQALDQQFCPKASAQPRQA